MKTRILKQTKVIEGSNHVGISYFAQVKYLGVWWYLDSQYSDNLKWFRPTTHRNLVFEQECKEAIDNYLSRRNPPLVYLKFEAQEYPNE